MTTSMPPPENSNFTPPLVLNSLTEPRQRIRSIEESKIQSLENRFREPNSEGKLPDDYKPLQESELENIKTQIISHNEPPTHEDNQMNSKSSTKSSKKKQANKNMFDYLMTKRQRENSNGVKEGKNNSQLSNIEDKSSMNVSPNNYQDVFSSKHCSTNNNLFTKGKNKNIKDYYSRTEPKIKPKKENTIITNISTVDTKKEIMLENELKEKTKLLNDKDKEIERLKQLIKGNEETINSFEEVRQTYQTEIKRCRFDISKFIKENESLKRQIKKRELNEKELKIGNIRLQRFTNNKVIDYWDDGEEFLYIKKRLEDIKVEKEEIEKMKRRLGPKSRSKNDLNAMQIEHDDNNDQRDLLNFKLNNLAKEEAELKDKRERLETEKALLIHEINLFNLESKCTFSMNKWPLLSGRYQITGLLGKGGYSEVYRAYDLETHTTVACKLHHFRTEWSDQLKDNYIRHSIRENKIYEEMSHPKIVGHYDTLEIDNNSFVTVLEYCTGPDLAGYMQKNRNISEKEGRIIITQILQGLEYLNKLPNKIIHYDLKPENIIFNNMEVKISDFGLAKVIENNKDITQLTSQGAGTYWYLPPECFDDKSQINISSKVDIWSCGIILYEMLFRKKPFGQNYSQDKILQEKVMFNARRVEFPPKPIISEECKDFIKNCLAYRQEDRYDVFQALNSSFIRQDRNKK